MDIREQLNQMLKVEGVDTVVVVGRDGFVIDGVAQADAMDVETAGAVVSSGIVSAELIGKELALGPMDRCMVEFGDKVMLVSLLGPDAMMAVMADPRFLGSIRYHVKKKAPEILACM